MINKKESARTRLERWGFNWFPAWRGTGGRITCISADYRYVEAKLPLNRRSRNYVGTLFGGSMFSVVDPVYMVMLYKILGKGYSVWVKSAQIEFLVPGKSTLYAVFQLSQSDIDEVKDGVASNGKVNRDMRIELKDKDGLLHAVVYQRLSIRHKEA